MANRFATAQSTVAMRRWGFVAIVTLAAMAALTALTADAAARQARPAPTSEATAPREAGEPIMAIVSIKSQQVTFYDAGGWIRRASVSTGIKGRETPTSHDTRYAAGCIAYRMPLDRARRHSCGSEDVAAPVA